MDEAPRISDDVSRRSRIRPWTRPAAFIATPIWASPLSMKLGEFGRVAPHRAEAAIAHELLELLGVVDLLQRRGELGRDVGGQALGAGNAAPGAGRIVDAHRFLQRRHVREGGIALGGHDGEAARLAGLDDGARFRHRAGGEVEAAGGEILHRGRGAVRRHPGHLVGGKPIACIQPTSARCQMPPWPVPEALNLPGGAALMASASSFTVL